MPKPKAFSRDSVDLGGPKRDWKFLEVDEIHQRFLDGETIQVDQLGQVRDSQLNEGERGVPPRIMLQCGENGWSSFTSTQLLRVFVTV